MSQTSIHQGLTLPTRKALAPPTLEVLPPPDEVLLPLEQHAGIALTPCIENGGLVRRGQPIATSSALGAWLHAPTSGELTLITYSDRLGCEQPALHIRADGKDEVFVHEPFAEWREVSPLALCEQLARGGIVGLGGAVFATATKLASHVTRRIDTLIINGVECEPYITCDDALMRHHADDIVAGVRILLQACQAPRALIAIETDKPAAIAAMRAAVQAVNDPRLEVHMIPTAYPSGDEGQLIARLLNMEIPRDCLPADIGVIVQNVATAHACARWVLHGEPLISRVVTVTGLGIGAPRNVVARIGMRCQQLITACGGYTNTHTLIMGGAMMGRALPNDALPITKGTNCLIAAAPSELPPARDELPCIRCGECMHACPVNLMPQQLLWHLRHDDRAESREALHEYGLRDCIECGCCDYVCPSHIALASRFHIAKQRAGTEP